MSLGISNGGDSKSFFSHKLKQGSTKFLCLNQLLYGGLRISLVALSMAILGARI